MGGMRFFLQEIINLGCSNVVYQFSIFYYARNWIKSLLLVVVVVVETNFSLAQAEQYVEFISGL